MKKRRTEATMSLNQAYDEVLENVGYLEEALIGLRYEGKALRGKNLKKVHDVLEFLDVKLAPFVILEEEIIFPFIEAHIPRMNSLVCLLKAQHKELKENLERFKSLFGKLDHENFDAENGKVLEKLRGQGTYLVHLIRHDIQVKSQSIYKIAGRELREDEKEELEEKAKMTYK